MNVVKFFMGLMLTSTNAHHSSLKIQPIERTRVSFRDDINFLRGIAILAVIFYHFPTSLAPGGFAGVDVFFVISGFLMTKIVATGLENGSFRLIDFYINRCKRIIPALFFLCIFLFALGWYWLPNIEFKRLGYYLGYVILFISNIRLNKESNNYFAADSHDSWILHTWSLSVEWQFYLLLPLLLMAWFRFGRVMRPVFMLTVLAVASFALGYLYPLANSSSPFYLMPFRAWEMLCGGIVCYAAQNARLPDSVRRASAFFGYALIVAAIAFMSPTMRWPGVMTLIPVVGTMLVLLARIESLPLFYRPEIRWIGLSSYSIYLWHWPVVVFLNYAEKLHSPAWLTGGVIVSLILGWLSWKYLEKPSQKYLTACSRPKFGLVLLCSVALIYTLSMLTRSDRLNAKDKPLIESITAEISNTNHQVNEKSFISHYGEGQLRAIIIGDSHAQSTATALAEAAGENSSVVGLINPGCPTLSRARSLQPSHKNCYDFNNSLEKMLTQYPPSVPVVIVNRSAHYIDERLVSFDNSVVEDSETEKRKFTQAFVEKLCSLSASHPVYLVKPMPEMPVNVPNTLARAIMTGKKPIDISASVAAYKKHNDFVLNAQEQAARQCNVKLLDPVPWLCTGDICTGSKDLKPLYQDDNHLSESGNKRLVPMFAQIFADEKK